MHRLQERVPFHRMAMGCREAMRLLRIGCSVERTHRKALQAEGLWDGDPADLPDLESHIAQALAPGPAGPDTRRCT